MKFIIHYSNGYLESSDSFNPTFLHLIDVGAVKFVIDIADNKVWMRSPEGTAIKAELPNVKGL